jgi:hypothetical protein
MSEFYEGPLLTLLEVRDITLKRGCFQLEGLMFSDEQFRALTLAERGLLLSMLCQASLNAGSVPDDAVWLAGVMGVPKRDVLHAIKKVRGFFREQTR